MPAPTGLTNGEQHLHEAEEAASANSDTAASPADSLRDAQQESTASRVSSYLNNLPETMGQHALPHDHVLLPQMVAMEGPSTSPGPPHHPLPPPEGSHVVLLHIVDGESIQFHRGDSVELIRGPATVQMVSSSVSPPMAYPVQVPPGHMMQQVVDGNGTLRHVILSPEPSTMPAEPAALSGCHRTPSSAAPAGFYPSAAAPANYMVEPLHHQLLETAAGKLSAAPPTPSSAEQQHLPHHLQQQRPSARYSTVSGIETGSHPLPSAAAQLNYSSCSGVDERQQRRAERLRRKLMERQRNQQLHPAASLQQSAGVARNGVGGADATDSDRAALSSCSPLSSGSPIEDDANPHTPSADQRQLTPPNATEVTSCSALIVWHHSRTTPPSDGCADASDHQLGSYQLLLAEQKLSTTGPPPASAYKPQQLREELPGPVTSCMLDSLRPATTYWIVLQLTAADDGSTCRSEAVRFTTLCAPPEPPLPPTLHSRTKTSLHLRWSAPHDNGSRIRQYMLECDAGAGFFEMYRGKSKQHSICHLQPGTVYRCRVAAINELGSGRASAVVALSTCGHVPPAPAPPQLLASRATALQLSWRRRDTDSVGFALQMEQEGSQYGFRAVYSGAETQFTADKLLPNTGYAFKLRAINEEGASAWSDVLRVRTGCRPPQPPTKLQLRGRTHAHQLRVQWEPPADTGGGQLVAYVLEQLVGPREAAGDCWEERYSGMDRDFTLANLAPGTSHCLRVLCEGQGGRSAPSATLQVATDPVVPGPCRIPRLLGRPRANSCQAAWSPPDFSGGESSSLVTGYQLRLNQAAEQEGDDEEAETVGGGEVVYEGSQLEASVTGLLPGKGYLLQVRAINSVGAGPWSEQLEFCSGAAAPDQPSAPRLASTVAATSLHLCWCPPDDHGAVVVDYRLEVSCGVSGQFQSRYHGSAVEYELRGLAPSTAYSVRVSAANAAGWSVPSEPLLAITAAASPAAVAQLAIEPTATELLVSWSAPVDHGAPITGYSVETIEQGAPSSSAMVCHTSGPLTRVSVASLRPETVYRVRVQATNSVGSGPFSAVCKSTTLCQPPPPPALVVTHTAHNWVRLRWTDPTAAPHTAHLLEYTLECEAKNGEFYTVYAGTGTQYKAARLNENSEYRFRICAANSAGDGPYSDVVAARTTTQLPPAVRGVRVTDRRETWARVEWTPVRSPTSPQGTGSGTAASSATPAALAVRYQVELAPINSSQFVKVYYGAENSCRLSQLEPGRDYQLRVCCCLVTSSIASERRSEGLTPSTAVARGPCTTPLRFSTTTTPSPTGSTPIHAPSLTVGANGMRAASNSTGNRQQTGGAAKTTSRVWTEKEWAGVILLGFGMVALLLAVVVHQVITVFTTK